MTEFFVDIRCLVEAKDIIDAIGIVQLELHEYILNSDTIKEHDIIRVERRRDDFYD